MAISNGKRQLTRRTHARPHKFASHGLVHSRSAHTAFDDPPFGVAEWIAFSPEPDSKQSPATNHFNLAVRFEEDLQITWNGWSELLKQMPNNSPIGLHPKLVPPRGCWLDEPQFSPSATALGF
jgi:hypothetical protein